MKVICRRIAQISERVEIPGPTDAPTRTEYQYKPGVVQVTFGLPDGGGSHDYELTDEEAAHLRPGRPYTVTFTEAES